MDGRSQKPFICVTDLSKGTSIKLPARHRRAVRCVAFSPCGKYLASVGADDNNSIIIWDWQAKQKLAEAKGDRNKIMCIEWCPKSPNVLVTTGVKHIFFWNWSGTKLSKKRGKSGKYGVQSFFAHKFTAKGNVFCGLKDGSVMMYGSNTKPLAKHKQHKGAVFAVAVLKDGFVSGGKDGNVVGYDKTMKVQWTTKLPGRVRSIYQDAKSGTILCGTHKSEIFVLDSHGKKKKAAPIVTGHYEGEVWGCDFQDGDQFLTSGEDNRVFRWSLSKHKSVATGMINYGKAPAFRRKYGVSTMSKFHPSKCARAVSASSNGHVALGRNDGQVCILETKSLKAVKTLNINKHSKRQVRNQKGNWIEAIAYSPDGTMLAAGTHGIATVIMDVKNNYKVMSVLKKSNAVITHLDWSKNSKHLRTNDKGYELLFYDIDFKKGKSKQNVYPSSLKDVDWATGSSILTWETQNIWDSDQDGSDVNGVDVFRGNGKALVATADDHGNVNLFRYPVIDVMNESRRFGGHSSHVTRVKFSPDGKYLVSTGGNDKSVVQWKVLG